MGKLLISLCFLISSCASANISRIYDTKNSDYIPFDKFIDDLPTKGHIVIGEFHNDKLIQNAQAKIIKEKVTKNSLQGNFSLMWEFLNYTDQEKINSEYIKISNGTHKASDFIKEMFGENNQSYSSIIDIISIQKGELYGINLPRRLKQKVIKSGIQSIDPKFIPADLYIGGENYLKRFKDAMGSHVPEDMIDKYFLAQCLTDSVMAEQIHLNYSNPLNFVIAGSFHTDFYDGTVSRLKNNYSQVKTLKIINTNTLSTQEINEILQGSEDYGVYADYVVLTK